MNFLIKMPLNLASFDFIAANRIKKYFPDAKKCYIEGHSHGGQFL